MPKKSRRHKHQAPKIPPASISRELKCLVGSEMYSSWLKMLKELVPHGRTHRLAVVVAGMLEYAAACRPAEKGKNKISQLLQEAEPWSEYDEDDETDDSNDETPPYQESLLPVVEQLFRDAKVKWKRVNSKGHPYSIAAAVLEEYFRWDFMPWE